MAIHMAVVDNVLGGVNLVLFLVPKEDKDLYLPIYMRSMVL